jgi:hypothetical protein
LNLLPPNLPFRRELPIAVEAFITFTPNSTKSEIRYPQGKLFVLSDLFLAATSMTREEKSVQSAGADMFLLFPPLSGKFLKVAPSSDSGKYTFVR